LGAYNLLDDFAKIESLVGQIYLVFMEQQLSSPRMARLWRKTADEEQNHELQFHLAKRLAKSIVANPDISTRQLKTIIDELTKIILRVKDKHLTPVESVRLAINIEKKLSEFHLDNIPLFSDKSLNELFKSMMKSDRGHVEELQIVLADLESGDLDLAA